MKRGNFYEEVGEEVRGRGGGGGELIVEVGRERRGRGERRSNRRSNKRRVSGGEIGVLEEVRVFVFICIVGF